MVFYNCRRGWGANEESIRKSIWSEIWFLGYNEKLPFSPSPRSFLGVKWGVMDETRCSQAYYSPLKRSKGNFRKLTKKLEQGLLPWQWWSNKAFAPGEFAKVCEELSLPLFISLFSKIDWSWISTMDCSFFSSDLSKERKFFEERRVECNLFLTKRL